MAVAHTVQFEGKASRPKRGLVLVYDLAGFSQFFNQPDVQEYVPKFLNRVSAAINSIIQGGKPYWMEGPDAAKSHSTLLSPTHEKFLGDGSMLIWVESQGAAITPSFLILLCNRLYNLTVNFKKLAAAAYDEMPVVDFPRSIRIGLAGGTVYELARKGTKQHEYIGFCLNLASRLQRYCPALSFIASARIGLPQATLDENGWIRVVAKEIKGFPREIVIVDARQYQRLEETTKNRLFETVKPD